MLKILSHLRIKQRADVEDARLVYEKIMLQSRKPAFFTPNRFGDNYDGRMEVLCLHLSLILFALRQFGKNGERLSQSIYDVMIADFDIALREEGLSDTGVARRIKPLAKMFFGRAKTYADILSKDKNCKAAMINTVTKLIASSKKSDTNDSSGIDENIGVYALEFHQSLIGLELGEIAKGQFDFPNFP